MNNFNNTKKRLIGERINEMRILKGISLKEMAEMLNISVDELKKYENGLLEIYPDMLLNISIVLNIEINELFKYVDLKFT